MGVRWLEAGWIVVLGEHALDFADQQPQTIAVGVDAQLVVIDQFERQHGYRPSANAPSFLFEHGEDAARQRSGMSLEVQARSSWTLSSLSAPPSLCMARISRSQSKTVGPCSERARSSSARAVSRFVG
jgi:hypothetical protein